MAVIFCENKKGILKHKKEKKNTIDSKKKSFEIHFL